MIFLDLQVNDFVRFVGSFGMRRMTTRYGTIRSIDENGVAVVECKQGNHTLPLHRLTKDVNHTVGLF